MRYTLGVVCLLSLLASVGWAAPVVIPGRVLSEAGKPVPNARVWVAWGMAGDVDETTSDRNGRFRLPLVKWKQRGRVSVAACADGHAVAEALYEFDKPGPLRLTLLPEAFIHGTVVGPDGAPVPEARVSLEEMDPQTGDYGDIVSLSRDSPIFATTDDKGKFTLGHARHGSRCSLYLAADGFARAHVGEFLFDEPEEAIAGVADRYTIRLKPGGIIEGTVTHKGKPVEGCWIDAESAAFMERPHDDWAVTDAQGRYRMASLAAGPYDLHIRHTDTLTGPSQTAIEVTVGKTVPDIDFGVTPGALIRGRVIHAETGEPITDGVVSAQDGARLSTGMMGSSVWSSVDETGRYEIRVVPGDVELYFSIYDDRTLHSEDRHQLTVTEGQTLEAPDIRVAPKGRVVITVTDSNGEPLEGAHLQVFEMLDPTNIGPTDAEGRVTYNATTDHPRLVVWARHEGRGLAGYAELAVRDSGTKMAIEMAEAAKVGLRVVDPDGNQRPGVLVVLRTFTKMRYGHHGEVLPEDLRELASDADGVLVFDGLPAGIEVHLDENPLMSDIDWLRVDWPEIPLLEPGAVHDLGNIVFREVPRLAATGCVLMPDGTPAAGATVRADVRETMPVVADAVGRFSVGGPQIHYPRVLLAKSADGALTAGAQVDPFGDQQVDITLSGPVRVTLRAIGPDEEPLSRCEITASAMVQELAGYIDTERSATTDADGRIVFENLIAGMPYRLRPQTNDALAYAWAEVVPRPGPQSDLGDVQLASAYQTTAAQGSPSGGQGFWGLWTYVAALWGGLAIPNCAIAYARGRRGLWWLAACLLLGPVATLLLLLTRPRPQPSPA